MSESGTPGMSPEQMREAIASLSSPDTRRVAVRCDSTSSTACRRPETVTTVYDALDLMRGIEVFLNAVPGASLVAMRRGLRSVGHDLAEVIGITDPRANSGSLFLTPNTETTYGTTFLDLRAWGPTVIEAPPESLCVVDDFWFRYVADMGIAGPTGARAASTCSCRPATTARSPTATSPTDARRSPTGWCSGPSAASRR